MKPKNDNMYDRSEKATFTAPQVLFAMPPPAGVSDTRATKNNIGWISMKDRAKKKIDTPQPIKPIIIIAMGTPVYIPASGWVMPHINACTASERENTSRAQQSSADIGRKKTLKDAENPKLTNEIMQPAKIASLSSRESCVVAVVMPLL